VAFQSYSAGQRGEIVTDLIEDRWLSNYAASVGDHNDCYFENRHGSPAVHPAYVSHLEWDAIGALSAHLDMSEDEQSRGVHSWNRTDLWAPITSGDLLESTATLVGVEQRYSGARLTYQIETSAHGTPVATSFTQTVFRGVEVEGDDVVPDIPKSVEAAPGNFSREEEIEFDKLAPYVFSECARDYGAIHTDRSAAESAGIPGLIMHGTGIFARVLSAIVNKEANGDPHRVGGFSGSLSAMVYCPSTTVLRTKAVDDEIHFELHNEDDESAIRNGIVWLKH